jgi:hypothetical protein
MARRGLTVSREQLEQWAGRSLSETEIDRLHACVSHSSIPEAIGEICFSFVDTDDLGHPDRR